MNRHKITNRQLLRCLRIVQDNCVDSYIWTGQSFKDFCNDKHNIEILLTLQGLNAVRLYCADAIGTNPVLPYAVSTTGEEGLLWYENSEKWKNRILGFIAGVLTTVIAQFFIAYVTAVL